MWAVVLKRTGAVIGHVGLQNLEGGDEIEIYYLLDKPHWDQGLATEAATAVYRFAREKGCETSSRSPCRTTSRRRTSCARSG